MASLLKSKKLLMRYPDAVVRIIDKLNKMASKFIEEKKGFDSCWIKSPQKSKKSKIRFTNRMDFK